MRLGCTFFPVEKIYVVGMKALSDSQIYMVGVLLGL